MVTETDTEKEYALGVWNEEPPAIRQATGEEKKSASGEPEEIKFHAHVTTWLTRTRYTYEGGY